MRAKAKTNKNKDMNNEDLTRKRAPRIEKLRLTKSDEVRLFEKTKEFSLAPKEKEECERILLAFVMGGAEAVPQIRVTSASADGHLA
jgi:hypothetical protein